MDEHEKVEGLEEERKLEFDNFIGIYKNWFSPENIEPVSYTHLTLPTSDLV